MCLAPQCHALFEHLNFPKCYEHAVLNSKCASRRNAVHFFNISTSKSAPNPPCFLHFDVHMCLAPQRHALFEHVNFQQCYGHVALFAFWLRNLLRATAACNYSSLIWPDGSAPAALASLLFEPPEPQKHSASRLFSLFAHLHLLSSNSFSSLIFFLLLFSTLTLPTSAFPSIVGILTSKLPSIRWLMVNGQWFYPSPSPMTINLIINVHIISYLYLMANGQ